MSHWVPPYFGSYERLLQELLHNPFLGSGQGHPHLAHAEARFKPQPDPWHDAQARFKPEPDP